MSMMNIEGSGSATGSGSIRPKSADPEPYKNVMDPQHCKNPLKKLDCGAQKGGGKVGSRRGRSEGAELEGENEGVEGWRGFNLCVRGDVGVRWQCGKKTFLPSKISFFFF
jgi:hypothetical protein